MIVLRSAPLDARPSIIRVSTPLSLHRFQRFYSVLPDDILAAHLATSTHCD
jgi:hypothetical protein